MKERDEKWAQALINQEATIKIQNVALEDTKGIFIYLIF